MGFPDGVYPNSLLLELVVKTLYLVRPQIRELDWTQKWPDEFVDELLIMGPCPWSGGCLYASKPLVDVFIQCDLGIGKRHAVINLASDFL